MAATTQDWGAIQKNHPSPTSVTLSTAYTFGDVMKVRHSLHWSPRKAPLFYGGYAALIALSAGIVLIPTSAIPPCLRK